MKNLLTISLIFCSLFSFATNRYVSNAGNDANPGTLASPYLTIDKVNAIFASLSAGDTIFFRRGDTFYGTLRITRSGLSGHSMVITAYGTGAKPIISGLTTITGWVNLGGNKWEATTTGVKVTNNLVLRNGVIKQVGRYPNANAANGGYLTYTASSHTSITGPALSSVTNWTNAEVAVRSARWEIRRKIVTSHSGGVVSFTDIGVTPRVNYGYFFQRDAKTLDQDGEWYQNDTTHKLRMYFANNNPAAYTIQASTVDTLISNTKNYITITNLAFTGSNRVAIASNGGTGITIRSCDAYNNGGEGFTTWFATNVMVDSCTTNNCLGAGIKVYGATTATLLSTVKNCTVNNTSMIAGMEISDVASDGKGINIRGGSGGIQALNNIVKNSGYNAIDWHGDNAIIRNNFIDSFCSVRDDGGGIYIFEDATSVVNGTNRKVVSNVITNGIGANYGTSGISESSVVGVYTDDMVGTVTIDSNTIANISGNGTHGNDNANLTIRYNTIFNCIVSISLQRFGYGELMRGMVIKKNIFYPYRFRYRNLAINLPTLLTKQADILAMGVLDSNYYSTKAGTDTSLAAVTTYDNGTNYSETYHPFSYITGTVTQETHSTSSATGGVLYYNASDTNLIIPFVGLKKKDPKGNNYSHYTTLLPWTSIVLINNGTVNIPPTASAGIDKNITLPVTSTSVTGSGADTDGTITAYNWVQISGPSTSTIVSPNAATTTINNLTVVGTYTYKFRVTDNSGDTAVDYVQVNVNPAVNVPPTANAGTDQSITLPTSSTTVSGSGSTDSDGTITGYLWAKISGPAGGSITSSTSVTTGITALQQGTYVFRLTVTDNGGLTAVDDVQIEVLPAIPPANDPPVANAGIDQNHTLPEDSTTLDGTPSTDSDGTITGYLWRKISGPSGGTIAASTSAITKITGLLEGVYIYQLRVTDNSGDTAVDEVQINVFDIPVNMLPVSVAGPDQIIVLPTDSALVDGSSSIDDDGSIASYKWVQLSGPTTSTIVTSTNVTTAIRGLVQGAYIYQLKVFDQCGDSAVDAVQITVNAAPVNIPPTANAGGDKSITLPTNSVTLIGSGNDLDGSIVSYEWTGADGTIVSPNSASTLITGLAVGQHTYTLTVTDDGGETGANTITVTVNPAPPAKHILLGIKVVN